VQNRDLTFDGGTSSIDAVQRALYRMSDRLSGDIRQADGGEIECTLVALGDEPIGDDLVFEFRNEVLDEVLRARIREETQEVRNLVLAVAFSKSGLIDTGEG
jgi:His-Xaa-Ser system protein HxsD